MHRLSLAAGPALCVALWLLFTPAPVADPGDPGLLVVVPWDGPGDLEPFPKDCWMLAYNQDLALVLLPPAFQPPAAVIETLEPPRGEAGDYYLFYVEDAQRAEFTGEVEVLYRRGHSVVLWSGEGVPHLTPTTRAALAGLQQPVRIEVRPHAWPSAPEARGAGRTDFHPLIEAILSQVTIPDYVEKWQVLDDFETRYYNTSQNTASSQYMYDLFESYGLQASFHTYNHSGTRRNVIGTLPGLVEPEKVVYLTGHFDSISEDPQNHAPGADDNGSGTAAFLEAARVMSQYAFHYTLKFVGFNSEEEGLIGSSAYCNYIAGLGEDVVGCVNLDMIAYAGDDPLPPDLIIYTNPASTGLAQIVHDACLEYVPDHVEPVIVNESIGASDHASFWDHGWQAVLGIEEEAWGSDFCPWYHTSDDRIEMYPQDYPTYCSMAAIASVAQLAIPLQPDSPYLLLESTLVDDDESGHSQGNGNGEVDFGETIELTVTLENFGQQDGTNIAGTLLCADEHVTVSGAQASFGTILAGGSGTNADPFVFSVSPEIPDHREIPFQLAISEAPDTLDFTLTAHAPSLVVVGFEVSDAVGGDGDGIPEPGEEITLEITAANQGSVGVTDVWGALSGGPYLAIDDGPVSFGAIDPEASAVGGPFTIGVSLDCPELFSALLTLAFSGSNDYAHCETFGFNIGHLFQDDMEEGSSEWSHYAGGSGYSDEWHLETYRNHTYGGTTSWKCGGVGSAEYGNDLYAILESSPFTLPAGAQLSFWHWIDAEISQSYPGYCYDGGLVEISIGGGPWEQITPDGGYPHLIRPGSNPLPEDTPVYSGAHDWVEALFDLSSHEGNARVRFVFASDGAVTAEGWYVDDAQLILAFSGLDETPPIQSLQLTPASSNPANGACALRLELPRAARADVEIFDATGRRVRTLLHGAVPAGVHPLVWDGRDEAGRPAGAGIYWAHARAGDLERAARVVIVR